MNRFFQVTAALVFLTAASQAQTFFYQGQSDPNPVAIGNGGTIPFAATQLSSSTTVQFTVTNNTTSPIQISGATTSNPVYTVSVPPSIIQPGSSGMMSIVFTPKASGPVSATLSFNTGGSTTYSFQLSGSGVAPNFITSYTLTNGNATAIGNGGTITFPATTLTQSSTAAFQISNNGTGSGCIISTSIAGASFQLSGLGLLPTTLPVNGNFQFNVVFKPVANDLEQGSLTITLGITSATSTCATAVPTSTVAISLSGQGSSATYSYKVISGSTTTPVTNGGTITFPQTQVGTPVSVAVQVTNTGNSPGSVNAISVVGTGFSVGNFLPPVPVQTLAPGATETFTLMFNPTTSGPTNAQLLIDSATFSLSGTGLGPQLVYSFVLGSTSTPLANPGTASFPNTAVGSTTKASISIQNTGNQAGAINSISLTAGAFSITTPPTPVSIAAGASVSVPIAFTPTTVTTVGPSTGTLTFDKQTISLTGTATAPPPLPSYTFTGIAGTASPATQPSIGLTLSAPYPATITGTITLSFSSSSFVDDPAIQFATGGLTANFTIPANTTTALFGSNGATSVQFQTGTVAGAITVTPSFATAGVNLTPATPTTQLVTIAPLAPVLTAVQVGAANATSFTVLITGYATSRSITGINLTFTGAPNQNLQTTSLSVASATAAFTTWYQSSASAAVGSQFTASIVISVNGTINAVQSVAATAVNAQGTSNSLTASLQ